jgi:hypothetical protein
MIERHPEKASESIIQGAAKENSVDKWYTYDQQFRLRVSKDDTKTNKLVIFDYCNSPSVATMCWLCNWISTPWAWAPTPTARHISTIINK